MEERQLIAACKKQDTNAQRELYEMYSPRMMGLCLKYCKDYDAAQDLLHDGFIKVFTQIKKYSGRGSLEYDTRNANWIQDSLQLVRFRRNDSQTNCKKIRHTRKCISFSIFKSKILFKK